MFLSVVLMGSAKELVYHDARQFPLYGSVVPVENGYTRFPDSLKSQVKRELLYTLGTNTAGMAIRFSSDATALSAKWVSTLELEMNHMTPVGIRGLDLYTLDENNEWNKPSAAGLEYVNKWNQLFVDTVRATGGNNSKRNLVVMTYAGGGDENPEV